MLPRPRALLEKRCPRPWSWSAVGGLLLAAASLAAASEKPAAAPATPGAIRSAWTDLASSDEAKATRAALVLFQAPKESVPFLKKELRPVKAEPKEVAAWIKDLDSGDFKTRESAQEHLEYLGKYVKGDLEKALAANPTPEAQRRLQHLLEAIPLPPQPGGPAPIPGRVRSVSVQNINGQVTVIVDGQRIDLTPRIVEANAGRPRPWARTLRAIAVLEQIGSPEAREVLGSLSGGEADALPTSEAKAALQRLEK